jgi:hypothetical protein
VVEAKKQSAPFAEEHADKKKKGIQSPNRDTYKEETQKNKH